MSRYTYGIECCPPFDPHNLDHVARKHMRLARPSGNVTVPGFFSAILEKVIVYLSSFDFDYPRTYINRILRFLRKKNSEEVFVANTPRRCFMKYQYIVHTSNVIGVRKQRLQRALIKNLVCISCW
jgi:hypothetical protein